MRFPSTPFLNSAISSPGSVETIHSAKSRGWSLSNFRKLRFSSIVNRLGASRIGVWSIKHLVSPFQRWLYRVSRGRFMSNMGPDREVLLLTTKGRRTGKDRTIPLFYLRYGEAVVICNIRPEFEQTNPWVLNLRHHPIVRAQIGSEIALYQARQANESEINQLWPRLVILWPAYQAHYERGGRRSIFILQRA